MSFVGSGVGGTGGQPPPLTDRPAEQFDDSPFEATRAHLYRFSRWRAMLLLRPIITGDNWRRVT